MSIKQTILAFMYFVLTPSLVIADNVKMHYTCEGPSFGVWDPYTIGLTGDLLLYPSAADPSIYQPSGSEFPMELLWNDGVNGLAIVAKVKRQTDSSLSICDLGAGRTAETSQMFHMLNVTDGTNACAIPAPASATFNLMLSGVPSYSDIIICRFNFSLITSASGGSGTSGTGTTSCTSTTSKTGSKAVAADCTTIAN